MAKGLFVAVVAALLCGCSGQHSRMEHAENPQGRYREQIAAAQAVLAQNEDWSERAEWEVIPTKEGWNVVAWRVEHPEAKGAERYSPVGYSVIQLDARLTAVHYLAKK